MANNYNSIYTGQQVDRAVGLALNIDTRLKEYLEKDQINITVAGLTSEKLLAPEVLPKATKTQIGGIMVGSGLLVTDGVISVDMDILTNDEELAQILQTKADKDEIPVTLSELTNDIVSVELIADTFDDYKLILK